MRRSLAAISLILIAMTAFSDNLRGPLVDRISVSPVSEPGAAFLQLEGVVIIEIQGDPRFFDALDLELTVPRVASEIPGALRLIVLRSVNITERAGVVDAIGTELLTRPIERAGKLFYQIPMRETAPVSASAAVTIVQSTVPPAEFPIALSVVPLMKGLSPELLQAEFEVAVRPVSRDIGAITMEFITEDGSAYDASELRTPEFGLTIDGNAVGVTREYLLEPGLHRISLSSERYQDQEITVGVERGATTPVEIPLLLALASVNYSAPRGARVYVDGTALDDATGDFTVPPGEHTIVVVVGDYTVTRRFYVEEGREYSVSILLDIAVEEIK